jgi:precorrin-2 dehydrogenase/sirohydrochlorin ferrochelatase|tara:strand:+ start:10937 stop:11536 length:600 start_codon:yes stop_codon:yes gene_type:complete
MINFNFDINDKRILIVGSGSVAKRRLKKIIEPPNNPYIKIISLEFDNSFKMLMSKKKNIYKVERPYRKGDLNKFDIVLACTNDKELNERISKEAIAKKILVNNASCRSQSNIYFTSNIKINNILRIDLSTNGKSPFISKTMRIIFERILKKSLRRLLNSITDKGKINLKKEKKIKVKLNNSDIIKKILLKSNKLFDELF